MERGKVDREHVNGQFLVSQYHILTKWPRHQAKTLQSK